MICLFTTRQDARRRAAEPNRRPEYHLQRRRTTKTEIDLDEAAAAEDVTADVAEAQEGPVDAEEAAEVVVDEERETVTANRST